MSYSFPTKKGTAATVKIPVSADTTGATVSVEFAYNRDFRSIVATKSVTGSGRNVTLALTAVEVDSLKDCNFRVKHVAGGKTSFIQDGTVDFIETKTQVLTSEVKAALGRVDPAMLTTASLQTLLDAQPTGGSVQVGPGTLTLDARLFIPTGVTLDCANTVIFVKTGLPIINDGKIIGAKIDLASVPLPPMPANLLPDPNFSNIAGLWTVGDDAPTSLTASQDTSGRGHNGKAALKLVQTAAAQSDRVQSVSVPVTAGKTYTAIVWVETSPFVAAALHGGAARGLWFQTSTVAGSEPAGVPGRGLAGATNGMEMRALTLVPAAGQTTAWILLYAPQGTTYWSDPIIFEGSIANYPAPPSPQDAVLGGELVNCTAAPLATVRPAVREWRTVNTAAKLSAPRDSVAPFRVTLFGDSIAESTASDSWMKMLSDVNSGDSNYLGKTTAYAPLAIDWTNRAMGGSTSKLSLAHFGVGRPKIDYGNYPGMHVAGQGRTPARVTEMELAILCVGQNGGPENEATVETTVRLLRSANVDVLLVATNPMNPAAENQGADRAISYRRIADLYGCGLADLNTEFRMLSAKKAAGRPGGYPLTDDGTGTVGLISDTVHPSALGRKQYARVIGATLISARPGASTLLPTQMVAPLQVPALRPVWGHQPRSEFNIDAVGAVTRQTLNDPRNPRSGVDLTQSTNGAYVLPASATYTNYLRFGTDGANGVTLIVLGNGQTQTFEMATQGGALSRGTITVTSSLSGRFYTAEIIPQGTARYDEGLWLKSSTGGVIVGVILHEPGLKIANRNPFTGAIDGLRFASGTWTLADFRTFTVASGFGQLYGSDSDTAAAEFSFNGTGAFMRVGSRSQASGRYQAYIDGVPVGSVVDGYSANSEPAFQTISVTGLPPGEHVMRVAVVGVNASALASPATQSSRRMVVAQIGTTSDAPVGYL